MFGNEVGCEARPACKIIRLDGFDPGAVVGPKQHLCRYCATHFVVQLKAWCAL